jgi:hypothetical protein
VSAVLNPVGQPIGSVFVDRTPAEQVAGVTPTAHQYAPGDVRRYGVTGSGNEAARLQNALNCGESVIDGHWIPCTSNSSLTVPAGVEFRNFDLTAGTAGINMLLVNTRSRLIDGRLTGTGTADLERGIYPADDGVTDVVIKQVEITNIERGLHAEYLTTDDLANYPKRWVLDVYVHDLVGTVGVSEGHGVMVVGIGFSGTIRTLNIPRHALYLSAGASHNDLDLDVDGCDNYALQIFATNTQNPCEFNTVRIKARNLGESVAGQGGAAAIVANSHRNKVTVELAGNGVTSFAVLVEGDSGGPYPLANEIGGKITGEFIGSDVIRMLNADSTVITPGTDIRAFATSCVIGMRRSGTNGSTHGGRVEGVFIDAQGENCKGIYDEINTVPSHIGSNWIVNTGAAVRVDDQTGGLRTGYSREARFSGTSASIAAGAPGDESASLPISISLTRRAVHARFTDSSGSLANSSLITRIKDSLAADEDHVAIRIYNAHSGAQTFDYEGVVYGD